MSESASKILYCRCAFAQAIPEGTKNAVLEKLCDSGLTFESVSDLCEMTARKDPRLAAILEGDASVRIVACYPRAVRWLFHHSGSPLPEGDRVEVLNMRESSADEIVERLFEDSPSQVSTS